MITVKTNLPDFRAQMQRLGKAFIPVARAATLAAARELAKEAKRLAPHGTPRSTGRLQRAIVVKRARNVERGTAHYIVGVRQGAAAQNVQRRRKGKTVSVNLDAFYWRFLEGGWVPRGPGKALKGGRRTKALQARRARASGGKVVRYAFLAPAFQSAGGRALSTFYAKLDAGVQKLK